MTVFNVHTIETANDGSKPLLEKSKKAYGFVPNLGWASFALVLNLVIWQSNPLL